MKVTKLQKNKLFFFCFETTISTKTKEQEKKTKIHGNKKEEEKNPWEKKKNFGFDRKLRRKPGNFSFFPSFFIYVYVYIKCRERGSHIEWRKFARG